MVLSDAELHAALEAAETSSDARCHAVTVQDGTSLFEQLNFSTCREPAGRATERVEVPRGVMAYPGRRAANLRWASRDGAPTWTSAYVPGMARQFHASMPGYRPTPLVELPELASELGVAAVLVKNEANRLGLPAFKILGASWAVNRALSQRSGFDTPATSLMELRERAAPVTLVTATDGNHGCAVARMAALLGLAARIYVPAGMAQETVAAISGEGAEVVQTDLSYDEVVWATASRPLVIATTCSSRTPRGKVMSESRGGSWTATAPCSLRSTNR